MKHLSTRARICLLACIAVSLSGCMGKAFKIGVIDGSLIDCPESPNCVSSMVASDDTHFTEPLSYAIPASEVIPQAAAVVREMSLTEIKVQNKHYLHAIYLTTFLRFVDDVEFLLDDESGLLHMRSASREGYSDFGTNRRRVRKIKEKLQPLLDGNPE